MTKDEYLADLFEDVANITPLVAQPQLTSPPDPETSNQRTIEKIEAGEISGLGTVTFWQTPIMEIGPVGVVQDPKQFYFKVFNLGVDGLEAVQPSQTLENPVRDMKAAVTYLETRRLAGDWVRYVEEPGGIKRSDLKFFTAKVWVDENGTLTESRIMVTYDDQGTATHKFIA